MGWRQFACLYYGLPLCKNFFKNLSPAILKHFVPFQNSDRGGILTLSRPHLIETTLLLNTDLIGPIHSDDWLYRYYNLSRHRPHHPADVISLLKYHQICNSGKVIFDVSTNDPSDGSSFDQWVNKNKNLIQRPLSYFVGYYLCGVYDKPSNIHDYQDLTN